MHLLRELSLTALLLLATGANAFYPKGGSVINVDKKNFKKEVLNTDKPTMVEFYAPWCGHCQNLKPNYIRAANSMRGLSKLAAVDCDDESNKSLCAEHGIEGFPTLKLVVPTSKQGKPSIETWQGPRTAGAIRRALAEKIVNHVTRVEDKKFDAFITANPSQPKAVLFSTRGVTTGLWKGLAIDFLGNMEFAQVRDTSKGAVERMGVDKFPTVFVFPAGSEEAEVYEGEMTHTGLYTWMSGFAEPTVKEGVMLKDEKKSETKKAEKKTEASAEPVAETEMPKVELDFKDLQAACLQPKSRTCVLFFTPEDSADTIPSDVFTTFSHRPPPQVFQFSKASPTSSLAKALDLKFASPDDLKVVALSAHRRWVRKYPGAAKSAEALVAWIDGVKLGEGAKEKLPEGLVEEEEHIEEQVVEKSEQTETGAEEERVKEKVMEEQVVMEKMKEAEEEETDAEREHDEL